MSTNVLTAPPSALERFQRLHLGPYLFSLGFAFVAYLVIGPAQFVNALTIGAIYALVAIGYTMVYGIIELINFAHGDVFMVGAFCSMFVLTEVLGQDGPINDPVTAGGRPVHRLRRHDAGHGAPGRDDRALRLPAAAQRAAPGAPDHGHRRVVHPPEHHPDHLRPVADQHAADHRPRRPHRPRWARASAWSTSS